MAEYKPVVITNAGQQVLFKAINGKYRLKFTSMAFGSGNYESTDTGINLTTLKSEKQRVDIQKIKTKNNNTVIIQTNVSNEDVAEGYYLTEVGIYVKNADDESSNETLYAVAIATVPDFMSSYNGTVPLEFILSFYITVNNAAEVTLEASGSPIAYLDEVYTKEESKSIFGLTESVTFDKDYIPLTTYSGTSLSTGSFATSNTSIKYVYISSKVTSVSSGTFLGCTNLTDIYVDNTAGNISFPTTNLPSDAQVHYVDNFNANSYIIKALLAMRDMINNLNEEKYNSSNVEAGRGTLTNVSTSGASVKSANYVYQRVGNFVNVNINIELNASSGEIKLSGLPVKTSEYSSGVCVVSFGDTLCEWSIASKSMTDSTAILSINKVGTGEWTHSSGESFSFMAAYEVF